jgi:hypothetical protein
VLPEVREAARRPCRRREPLGRTLL